MRLRSDISRTFYADTAAVLCPIRVRLIGAPMAQRPAALSSITVERMDWALKTRPIPSCSAISSPAPRQKPRSAPPTSRWCSMSPSPKFSDSCGSRHDSRPEAFSAAMTRGKSRFEALGASLPIQRVQLEMAAETYSAELARETAYASKTTSQRGLAFLLDLANQFGPGRVEEQYKRAAQPGVAEPEILKAMEDAFTAIARPQFQPQVRARRAFFRTTPLLTAPANRSPTSPASQS